MYIFKMRSRYTIWFKSYESLVKDGRTNRHSDYGADPGVAHFSVDFYVFLCLRESVNCAISRLNSNTSIIAVMLTIVFPGYK